MTTVCLTCVPALITSRTVSVLCFPSTPRTVPPKASAYNGGPTLQSVVSLFYATFNMKSKALS